MFKVNVTIGDIAKPGDYADPGFFKDEKRLVETEAITALAKGEKVPDDAAILQAVKEPAKEVKKA